MVVEARVQRYFLMMNNRVIHLLSTPAQHFLLQQVFVRSMSIKEQRVGVHEECDLIKKK